MFSIFLSLFAAETAFEIFFLFQKRLMVSLRSYVVPVQGVKKTNVDTLRYLCKCNISESKIYAIIEAVSVCLICTIIEAVPSVVCLSEELLIYAII